MRLLWLCLFLGPIFLLFSVLPFLLFPKNGEVVGVGLFCVTMISILLLGDKILLALGKSRRLRESSPITQRVNSIIYRKSFRPVVVYASEELEGNIFVLGPLLPGARPSLVVGRGIEGKLSEEEWENLLDVGFRKIDNRDSFFNALFASWAIFLCLPFLLIPWERPQRTFLWVAVFFLRPFFFLHRRVARRFDYGANIEGLEFIHQKLRPRKTETLYLKQSLMELLAVLRGRREFLVESLLRY